MKKLGKTLQMEFWFSMDYFLPLMINIQGLNIKNANEIKTMHF